MIVGNNAIIETSSHALCLCCICVLAHHLCLDPDAWNRRRGRGRTTICCTAAGTRPSYRTTPLRHSGQNLDDNHPVWEQVTILWYEQQVEGQRPDLEIVYPIERHADYAERPVCLARHVPVDANWHPTNVGALICLYSEPGTDLPERVTPVGTSLHDSEGTPILELVGYQLEIKPYNTGAHVPLIITWRALTDVPHDYSISLHLLDEAWNSAWSRDIQSPVMGMYATSRWVEGEVVQDYHEIDIPRDLPSGRYLWTVVVYRQLEDSTFEHLRDAEDNVNILGGTLVVKS